MARLMVTKAMLLGAALVLAAVPQASAQRVFRGGHGPPDPIPKAPRICVAGKVTCSATIYATVGERCSCVTPAGRKLSGAVHWKNWR